MTNGIALISDRVIYSVWDFQQALSALTFLIEECEYDKSCSRIDLRRYRCFEAALIVSFARPFKVGRGRRQLDLSVIGFKFTAEEAEIKDKLIKLRDKVVSHSDEEEMEFRADSIKVFEDDCQILPVLQFREALYLEEAEIHKIERLLRRLIQALVKYQMKFALSKPDEFNRVRVSTPGK